MEGLSISVQKQVVVQFPPKQQVVQVMIRPSGKKIVFVEQAAYAAVAARAMMMAIIKRFISHLP